MIAMHMKWDGITKEQYEQIRKTVDWEKNVAPGAVLHVACFDDKGMRVTDVWEAPEDFNNFVQNRLMPAVAQIGVQSQPQAEIYPVHNLFTPAFTAKRVLEAA